LLFIASFYQILLSFFNAEWALAITILLHIYENLI